MQKRINNFIIPYLYGAQHVSGDTPPTIRSLKLHWQPLVFRKWKVVGRVAQCAWQRPKTTRPTTFHVWKTRGCQCSFRLLMVGGVSPETCWASYNFFLWRCDPTRVMASSFTRFVDHTQRRTTFGKTPLDKWSARRRDLYLTTHNTTTDKHPCPRWDSNPRSQQASGRRP